jgi:hypothetical protein
VSIVIDEFVIGKAIGEIAIGSAKITSSHESRIISRFLSRVCDSVVVLVAISLVMDLYNDFVIFE